jgi:hypothetical protein
MLSSIGRDLPHEVLVCAESGAIFEKNGSLEASLNANDVLLGGDKKAPSIAGLYPKELLSPRAMREGLFLNGGIS